MTYIIINADDFGYDNGICKSIFELLDAGAITSTSLMCAAIGAEKRFRSWNTANLLGFAGVHLQLTGGKPLLSIKEVPTLYDYHLESFNDPRSGKLPNIKEVELEWRRQIDNACTALGGPPTHLDTHDDVHRIPELFEVYTRLGAELGVSIRGANGDIGKRMRSEGILGTIALVRDWTGRSLDANSLRQMVTKIIADFPQETTIEVITHPGHNNPHLPIISASMTAREEEHKALLELVQGGWPTIDGHILASHACLSRNQINNSKKAE